METEISLVFSIALSRVSLLSGFHHEHEFNFFYANRYSELAVQREQVINGAALINLLSPQYKQDDVLVEHKVM